MQLTEWQLILLEIIADVDFSKEELLNDQFMIGQIENWKNSEIIDTPYSSETTFNLIKDEIRKLTID